MTRNVRTVFSTPWFRLEEIDTEGLTGFDGQPYYRLAQNDGVMILPLTRTGNFILIRHYRLAPDALITEIPAGSIDDGETPEQAARRELAEETGRIPGILTYLGPMRLRMEREADQQHLFVAENVERDPSREPEAGIEVIEMTPEELKQKIAQRAFSALPTIGIILAAECVLGRALLPR